MTKKVVINKCYGGFGLSLTAKERLHELKALPKLFHYSLDYRDRLYKKIGADKEELFTMSIIKDYGDSFHENDFTSLKIRDHYPDFDYERHDEDLVKVVEELGLLANTRYSDLKIVEIPKDVEYQIEEYDGIEWVAERHRTWG